MEFFSRALHSLHALQLLLLPHLKNTIPLHVLHSFLPDSDIVRSQQESSGGSWSLVTRQIMPALTLARWGSIEHNIDLRDIYVYTLIDMGESIKYWQRDV